VVALELGAADHLGVMLGEPGAEHPISLRSQRPGEGIDVSRVDHPGQRARRSDQRDAAHRPLAAAACREAARDRVR